MRKQLVLIAVLLQVSCGEENPAILSQEELGGSSCAVQGTVVFADGSPAVWTTRLGYPASANVCITATYCAVLGENCMGYHSMFACAHVDVAGEYCITEQAISFVWLEQKDVQLQVREDLSSSVTQLSPGMVQDFTLPFDRDGLKGCLAAEEVCDKKDNNCNGMIDEVGDCATVASTRTLVRISDCAEPSVRDLYRDSLPEKIVLPISLHYLRADDGDYFAQDEDNLATYFTFEKVSAAWEQQLAYLKTRLGAFGVFPEVVSVKFVDDTNYLTLQHSAQVDTEAQSLFKTYNDAGVVNVYIVHEIQSDTGVEGIGSYPGAGQPGIALTWPLLVAPATEPTRHLLAHEFGHFLGLLHTFESNPYGEQCHENGDFICDTPDLGAGVCDISIMGYHSECLAEELVFTPEQEARMKCSLDREHYRLNF